ncbi:hypothetical protein GCM10023321_41490 [Pseudonocardia eucalypti]|uniref:Uncharacterized protein n=1 Tax=Pseudonocardia eucalypti TaxID=648755 RepID=A0ABP9QD06_9PSEU|nr:hypothetical protein [Pseudonocardia eucalypti]
MADTTGRVRPECTPEQVGTAVDALYTEARNRPRPEETPSWEELIEAARWRMDWYERLRVQWGRLGEWALLTGQPHVVWRAVLDAEWLASSRVLEAEADVVQRQRAAAAKAARAGAVA